MPRIIDYVKGELVTPEGKKVKKITEGATPTDQAVFDAPINTGGGNYYAPGFGSNQTLDYEYYADDPEPAPQNNPPAPTVPQSQLPNPSQGNSRDVQNDDKSGAGAIPDLESWAEAVITGMGPVGIGGPITSVIGQAAGVTDFGDDFNNYNQTDPEGWKKALEEAAASLPPGAPQQQIITRAANIMANSPGQQPGGGYQDDGRSNEAAPSGGQTTAGVGQGNVTGPQGQPNFGDLPTQDTGGFSQPTVTTASGPKPPKGPTPPGKPSGAAGGFGSAGSGPNYGSGTTPGSGADPSKGNQGGGHGSGSQPGKPDTAGATAGGEKANPGNTHFNQGGYVSDAEQGVPTSMRQMYRRPAPTQQQAAPQKPNGNGGYNAGGHVTQQAAPQKPSRTQRYMQSRQQAAMPQNRATGGFVAAQGFADGGVVPQQGYNDGGAVTDDRFNPSPAAIADDGVIDNQQINADEGEYVIQREAADILGPEILNALNDPVMAKAFSDLFDAVLGLDAGSSTEGVSPAPALPPKTPAAPPAAPMGASLANDNGPEAMPAFRKGGYVGKRC